MLEKKEETKEVISWINQFRLCWRRTKIKVPATTIKFYPSRVSKCVKNTVSTCTIDSWNVCECAKKPTIQTSKEEFEKRINAITGKKEFDVSNDKQLLSDIVQGVKLSDEIYQFDANPKRLGFQQVMEREFEPPLINGYDWEILSKEKNLVGVKAKQACAVACKECLWTCAENADPSCTIPCLKYFGCQKMKTNIREDRKDAFMMHDQSTNTVWVSCRGTQNFKDIVTDLNWHIRDYTIRYEDYELELPNAAHERTVDILKNLIMFMVDEKYDENDNESIVPKEDKYKDGKKFFQNVKRIGFCGHSLGGGVATNLYLLFCNLQKSDNLDELNLDNSRKALSELESKIKALSPTDILTLPRLLYKKSKYSQYIKDIEYIKKNFSKQLKSFKTILVTLNSPLILNSNEDKFGGKKADKFFKDLAENAHNIVTRFDIVARSMGKHTVPKFPYSASAPAFSAIAKLVNDRLDMKRDEKDGKPDREYFIPFGKYYSLIPGFVDEIQNLAKAKLYIIDEPNDLLKEVPPADQLHFKNAIRDHGSDFAVKALETLQMDWKLDYNEFFKQKKNPSERPKFTTTELIPKCCYSACYFGCCCQMCKVPFVNYAPEMSYYGCCYHSLCCCIFDDSMPRVLLPDWDIDFSVKTVPHQRSVFYDNKVPYDKDGKPMPLTVPEPKD